MFINQMSVFIENKRGRLAEFAKLLGDNNIDMLALSIADTTDFGILRVIVSDSDNALKVTKAAGYTVTITKVIAASISDKPGGTYELLDLLQKHDISVEYAYSFVRHVNGSAVVIFRVDDFERAAKLISEAGIHLLDQDEISKL